MADIYIENMSYRKAIEVLENIYNYGNSEEDVQTVVSAIYKIKNMATINAVSKTALMNAVVRLFHIAFEIEFEIEEVADNGT